LLNGDYKILYERLLKKIPVKRLFHDPMYTLALGTDASFYRLIPKLVIRAWDEDEIILILRECSVLKIPVTFRAAGTSLSGQAVTDSVLVIAGDNWKKYSISKDLESIRMQPGLTGGRVNSILARYGKKIGPDPASINAAMIGGIAANNASGMCCGTAQNSYRTVSGIRIILADGTLLDTSDPENRKAFSGSHAGLLSEISEMASGVKNNKILAERIRQKYKLKNTTGYSLNALTDFTDPFEIIEHLMIGSEGTLGFISEIVLRTVPEYPCRASSLMLFRDTESACSAVIKMKSEPVSAAELIDRTGLRSVENEKGLPSFLKTLGQSVCAILVETVAPDPQTLNENIGKITAVVAEIPVAANIEFTSVPGEYELLWKIRKGLFPSVGAMRKTGTTVIIEDVAFPVGRLGDATADLRCLLDECGYQDAVIFGHALEGNLHFVFTQDFNSEAEAAKYSRLMNEVAELVTTKYDGSLKAEHGTGRNMAPYVEKEWGEEAFALMKRIKRILDPDAILNPGVILNDDKQVHLKNLKPLPRANAAIDKCTECGFCEPSCVSAGLTLTPRQRIAVYRELAALKVSGREPHIASSLSRSFAYAGDATCATDGLCALNCPVKIDTGKLIKELRTENIGSRRRAAAWISANMNVVTASARAGLSFIDYIHSLLGTEIMKSVTQGFRWLSAGRIPAWNGFMPKGARKLNPVSVAHPGTLRKKVVYFPSCINRSMGVSKDHREEKQLTEKMIALLNKGGYDPVFTEDLDNLCCGMAFMSKGYVNEGQMKSDELKEALLEASNNGLYPVLCEMSPCLYTMKENMPSPLRLYEPVEFILEHLLPNLDIKPVEETISVFPVCSMKKMGLDGKLEELAKLCATGVVVPETNCCGFAGDRGFTHPELNSHGLRELAPQTGEGISSGYSTSRTCEIGLSLHSGISYKSIVYLVDRVSRAKGEGVTA
jgi:D-lactate dehydrogenase